MIPSKDLTISLLLALLLTLSLGCGEETESPATPPSIDDPQILTPQAIAEIAAKSTVYLRFTNAQGVALFGSGFVVREGGFIATTYHAAADMKTNSTAQLVSDVLIHPVEAILAVDKAHDLAIVQCPRINAPPLPLGDSDTVRVGDMVYAVSNPVEYIGTFSAGFISAIRSHSLLVADKAFQITAPVSEGSSGGPILNERGKIVGIVSSTNPAGQNLNFAIPVNFLKELLAAQ